MQSNDLRPSVCMPTSASRDFSDVPGKDEFSLDETLRILRSGWRWWVGGAFAGVLIAATELAMIPPQYEASCVVQMGRIWKLTSATIASAEPAGKVVERIMLQPFQESVLHDLGWQDATRVGLFHASLKAVAKGEDLVGLAVRAPTREDARQAAEATVAYLRAQHEELARISREQLHDELTANRAAIQAIEKMVLRLEDLEQKMPQGNYRERLTALNLLAQREDHRGDLQTKQAKMEQVLAEMGRSTEAIEGLTVSVISIVPRGLAAFFLGGIGGGFLGAMAVLLRASRMTVQRRQQSGMVSAIGE